MKKHELNETQRKAYRDLFVNRDDTYQRQNNKGIPYRVKSPLTDDILFNPNENVGAYQLNNHNNIKYAVLDIDLIKKVWSKPDFDLCNWIDKLQEQTFIAYNLLKAKGIDSLIECSGFKGYHLWIFFKQPMDAGIVKQFMHDVFDDMNRVDDAIEWEIFPKQDNVSNDGFGSYVKPPLQIHQKSGHWSYFVDENFNEIDVDLTNVPKIDIEHQDTDNKVTAQPSQKYIQNPIILWLRLIWKTCLISVRCLRRSRKML